MDKETRRRIRGKVLASLMRGVNFFIGKIPLRLIYFFGALISKLFFVFDYHRVKIALTNLERAFPDKPKKFRKQVIKDFLSLMVQSLLEVLYFISNSSQLKDIRLVGKEYLDEALIQKNGVIGLTAHFGNFPLMYLKLAQLGYSINVFIRPIRDKAVRNYVHQLCYDVGIKLIYSFPRVEAVRKTVTALRNNELVVILMDQDVGDTGVASTFFGQPASTPTGPVIFGQRTGAVVMPMWITRVSMGKHKIEFLPGEEVVNKSTNEETILFNAQRYTAIIEKWVAKEPAHWGWIHDRWKTKMS